VEKLNIKNREYSPPSVKALDFKGVNVGLERCIFVRREGHDLSIDSNDTIWFEEYALIPREVFDEGTENYKELLELRKRGLWKHFYEKVVSLWRSYVNW
jgi:hypothetical protein